METRFELLQKLGFSSDYLQIIESGNQNAFPQQIENSTDFIEEIKIVDEITSLIIDKSEVPTNTHFIYNEK